MSTHSLTTTAALVLVLLVVHAAAIRPQQPAHHIAARAAAAALQHHDHHHDHHHQHRHHHHSDPCNIGPSYWCQSKHHIERCKLEHKSIEACGFGTTEGACHPYTVSGFCKRNPWAEEYNGGIIGSPAGLFGYFGLALYWAPSSCRPGSDIGQSGLPGGFCTNYTKAGSYASRHLVLHGLWPDFLSEYEQPPVGPSYNGSYQGFPMWCDGPDLAASRCSVVGGACPWPAARFANFSQHAYEKCMRHEGVRRCTVSGKVLRRLHSQLEWLAPGYLGDGTFIDHEYFKHGSCVGGYLTRNATAFFELAMRLALEATLPGTAADRLIHQNIGHRVRMSEFDAEFGLRAVPTCHYGTCNLQEIWICYDRDADGYPTQQIKCPAGTLRANSCRRHGCKHIEIPAYPELPPPPPPPTPEPPHPAPEPSSSPQ